jgi:hypothetical protein
MLGLARRLASRSRAGGEAQTVRHDLRRRRPKLTGLQRHDTEQLPLTEMATRTGRPHIAQPRLLTRRRSGLKPIATVTVAGGGAWFVGAEINLSRHSTRVELPRSKRSGKLVPIEQHGESREKASATEGFEERNRRQSSL